MGNFSRDTFDKLKHYVGVRLQQGVPLVDADWNEQEDIRKYELQAFLKWFVGDGVPKGNDGFGIEAIPAENDFWIKGGDGTPDGAGRCLVEGWDVMNENDIKYTEQPLYNNDSLAEEWGVDPLSRLKPPKENEEERTDTVYLDVWERKVDAEEDYEHLVNPAIGIETCVRLKREWAVRVAEGKSEPPSPAERHVFYPLASLRLETGVAAIDQDDIKDLRCSGLAVLSKELTIKDGNVGIGTTEPEAKLDIASVPTTSNGSPLGSDMWLRVGDGGDSGRVWVEYGQMAAPLLVLSDLDDRPRIQFQQIGKEDPEDPYTEENPKFVSWIGHARRKSGDIAIMGGNVGIGTTEPEASLDVNGGAFIGYETTISDFGNVLKSGFYQNGRADIPGDVPDDSSRWSHLITARHSNRDNNHQLQIASSYKNNDRLFFRKIQHTKAESHNPPWHEMATRGSNTFPGNQYFIDGKIGIGTISPDWGKVQIETGAVPLAFREKGQSGAGSLWRIPLDGKKLRFDVSQNGTNFDGYVTPLAMTSNGNIGIGTTEPEAKLEVQGGSAKFVTSSGNDPLIISRFHGITQGIQELRVGVGDTVTTIHYINDEAANKIDFRMENTDTETGGGANANNNVVLSILGNKDGGSVDFHRAVNLGAHCTHLKGYEIQYIAPGHSSTHWIKAHNTNALGFQKVTVPGGVESKQLVTGPGWQKNFLIDHPLYPEDKYLVHSTLEGPEVAVFYRGEAQLSNGEGTVTLPEYFEGLTRKENRTVLLTPKFEEGTPISMLAASEIKDGQFTATMIDSNNPSQKFYWEVKAVRADVAILQVEQEKTAAQ